MAGDELAGRLFLQRRLDLGADRHGVRAPRMKAAAGGGIENWGPRVAKPRARDKRPLKVTMV